MKAIVALVSVCALCPVLPSQEIGARYVIGVNLFGGSKPSCPVFIGTVRKHSPAAKAGIEVSDRLIAVDGQAIADLQDAARRITSRSAKPVTMQLIRNDKPYTAFVEREDVATVLQKDGWKMLEDGSLVSSDATDAEVKHHLAVTQALENAKDISVVFPGHYPANKKLYYPGFEALIWDSGNQVTVGGIEDGPASRAGVRWGDRIIAVNGTGSLGKSVAELESLLTSSKPASLTLAIERAGARRTFSFELAQAAAVLGDNQRQVVNGKLIPLWVPEKYWPCFE